MVTNRQRIEFLTARINKLIDILEIGIGTSVESIHMVAGELADFMVQTGNTAKAEDFMKRLNDFYVVSTMELTEAFRKEEV